MGKRKNIIALFLVLAVILQLSGCEFPGDDNMYGTANVSPLVERWRPYVQEFAQKYGVGEYVEILLAMIAQESGGDSDRYPDILQCSESAGMAPNSITDPLVSLEQGIRYFAALAESGKKAGVDMDTVIQSYNFGGGYLTYVRDHYGGKHSEEAARSFSGMMAARSGWSSYGDVKYVEHVRSHMHASSVGGAMENYEAMYAVMKEYENVPYVFGGTSKSGIDCSAMSQKLYQSAGISLPRTAQDQYDAVSHISESQARPGDLVFFTATYDAGTFITHVGVYTGNGQFFHAGGNRCQFSALSGYYREKLVCFGRK